MKGVAIEQVFWILVILIVIGVGIMIFIREQVLASEQEERFSRLFGKEILTTYGDNVLEVESSPSADGFIYDITVENLNFYYKKLEEEEEEELQFYAVADFKERVAIAEEYGKPKVISYPEDKNVIVNFELESTKEPEDKEFLHLTFWRTGMCVEDFFTDGEGNFYDLLAKCPKYYISSVDVSEWVGRALCVKFDIGEAELWAFYITNNPDEDICAGAMGSNNCKGWIEQDIEGKCVILANEEDTFPTIPHTDDCALTTAGPGSLISLNKINIRNGLVTWDCKPSEDACDILEQGWIDNNIDLCIKGNCDERLLTKTDGKFNYEPKIEILCDNDGYWVPCYSGRKSEVITAGGKTYNCTNGEWVIE